MSTAICHRAIALAGLYQAARLVQQTASGERRNEAATTASLQSIFKIDPESVPAVYGDIANIGIGLDILVSQLGNRQHNLELTRYVLLLLHLERKLNKIPALLEQIRVGIDRTRQQAGFSDLPDPAVIAGLAGVYRQTISTLQPRIMVNGEPNVLADPDSQNMIRALLLAGMRAAVLWRQCGGTRLKLILQRRPLLECAGRLLTETRTRGPGV